MEEPNKKTTVLTERLSSIEHYSIKGKEPVQILRSIDLLMKESESWGIYGQSPLEIKLLLEILANIVPYHDGKCVLIERGMMRKKRVVIDHVFYIGTPTMPYNNMNVLEFLMFATARQKNHTVHRQDRIFSDLLALGLDRISLSLIGNLTKEEKAVVTLMTAIYSESAIIVFNFPEYKFDETLITAVQNISNSLVEAKKTLVLGSRNSDLIEKTCSHTAYVRDGTIIYQGKTDDLRFSYDNLLVTIKDTNVPEIRNSLQIFFPEHYFSVVGDSLLIYDNDKTKSDPLSVYEKIAELKLAPKRVSINPKTVKNAYKEIDRQYALQRQLFR